MVDHRNDVMKFTDGERLAFDHKAGFQWLFGGWRGHGRLFFLVHAGVDARTNDDGVSIGFGECEFAGVGRWPFSSSMVKPLLGKVLRIARE
jgi:hypothetical protein